jgi:hypothetical protein
MTDERRKCLNPECNCPAPAGGDYCSDYCQDPTLGDQTDYDQPIETGVEPICYCDHIACQED